MKYKTETEKVWEETEKMESITAEITLRELAEKLERERDEALAILSELDNAIRAMRPRFTESTASMDGKSPCWVVWLPVGGTSCRKSLLGAVREYSEQTKSLKK